MPNRINKPDGEYIKPFSIEYYTDIIAAGPKCPEQEFYFIDGAIYILRGIAYYCKGDYDNAIVDHSNAIELAPKNAWGYCSRGDAYLKKGSLKESINDYTEAIKLCPREEAFYTRRGDAYLEQKKYYKAERDYMDVIELCYEHDPRLDDPDNDDEYLKGLVKEIESKLTIVSRKRNGELLRHKVTDDTSNKE